MNLNKKVEYEDAKKTYMDIHSTSEKSIYEMWNDMGLQRVGSIFLS